MDSFYYFFMKVGNSNCFLPFAQQLGGLWVGYDGLPLPQIEKNIIVKGKEQADLRYLQLVSQSHLRHQIRVVSYGKDSLQIFRITDSLRLLGPNKNLDWSNPHLYITFPTAWKESVKQRFGQVGSKEFMTHMQGPTGWKLLPARLEANLSRSSLIAPIDSLSVWQSFNRRTFQPMFSLEGTKSYTRLEWLKAQTKLPPLQVSQNEILNEGRFGQVIRYYLDAKSQNQNSVFQNLSEKELTQTLFCMLNPAQVETIASHLCLDLGLTADVGVGKGLDVADVKGTVRHLEPAIRLQRIKTALQKLEGLDVQLTERLRNCIEATSTLRFQCKARTTSKDLDLGTVLLIEPGATTARSDTLFLERLSEAPAREFPHFHDWLRVLRYDLTCQNFTNCPHEIRSL